MDAKEKRQLKWTLALGIALLPPIWAVLSSAVGITTGAVALICAGVYVANGNKTQDAVKISIGFLLGDLWAVIATFIMEKLQLNPNVEVYMALFFIPAAVGIVQYRDFVMDNAVIITVTVVLGIIVNIATVGYTFEYLARKKEQKKQEISK